MNRDDVKRLSDDFRNNIYVQSFNHHMTVIDFEQWGAGEYKLNFNVAEKFGKFVHLYIPYASISTLEKAIVFTRFAEKQGVTIVTTLVGYVAYGRQERETDKEPELLTMTKLFLHQLTNVQVIDPHNIDSMSKFKKLFFTTEARKVLPKAFVVAPDRGADERNQVLGIYSHITIDKHRNDGEVESRILHNIVERCIEYPQEYSVDNYREYARTYPFDFIIYDDICDGGRTFVNVAKLIKEEYPNSTVTLCVSHAILPFGTEHLKEYIDQIFTLNTCFPLGVYDDGFVEVWDAMEVFYK